MRYEVAVRSMDLKLDGNFVSDAQSSRSKPVVVQFLPKKHSLQKQENLHKKDKEEMIHTQFTNLKM
jgi:hypothetical protein